MDARELSDFIEALSEAERHLASTAALVQRAKARCHDDIFDHVDVISKRLSELRVRAQWLRHVAQGDIDTTSPPGSKERHDPDRRVAIDRRVAGMRHQLQAVAEKLRKAS